MIIIANGALFSLGCLWLKESFLDKIVMSPFCFTQIYSVSYKFEVSGPLDLSQFSQDCKINALTEPWHIEFVTYGTFYAGKSVYVKIFQKQY